MNPEPARLTMEGIYVGEKFIPASIITPDVVITNYGSGQNSASTSPYHTINIELVVSTISMEGGNYRFCEPRKLAASDGTENITLAKAWSNGVAAAGVAFMELLSRNERSVEILKVLSANNPYTVGKGEGEPKVLTAKHIIKPSL